MFGESHLTLSKAITLSAGSDTVELGYRLEGVT